MTFHRTGVAVGSSLLIAAAAIGSAGAQAPAPPAAPTDIWTAPTLLGDIGGLRPWLQQNGMTLTLTETSEILGNITGGVRRGFEYDGLTTATFQLDTARAFGWDGGTFNASALQIHGRNLSADNLDTLQTASGIEADHATRLWELWYQQKFWNGDVDVKIGLQSLDQEFMDSTNALLFVNTSLGWPIVPSVDMPGGGPAYPLSAPGVRFRFHPTQSLTLLAGIFNGNPAPNGAGDPQQLNPSGTSFPLDGGVLAIAELQYAYPSNGSMAIPGQAPALARTYRIGLWYDSENFADERFDNAGLSLANPLSTGMPRLHRGDYGLYAVADQVIWQSEENSNQSVSAFTRIMGTPQDDRNLVDFGLDLGLTYKAPLPGRDNDTAGVALGYAHVSGDVAELDHDMNSFGTFAPPRSGETFIELTYQVQVTPWWQIQPDFQYVFNPGGGVADPNLLTQKIKDEAVIGVRTNITF